MTEVDGTKDGDGIAEDARSLLADAATVLALRGQLVDAASLGRALAERRAALDPASPDAGEGRHLRVIEAALVLAGAFSGEASDVAGAPRGRRGGRAARIGRKAP